MRTEDFLINSSLGNTRVKWHMNPQQTVAVTSLLLILIFLFSLVVH